MPSQPAIPALLSPLLQTPPKACSLSLLTSVLSASTNWLVLRFIYAALAGGGEKNLNNDDDDDDGTTTTREFRVLIISWLRGLELWREMGKKLGVDFSRGGGGGGGGDKLAFLDGLGSVNFGGGGGGGGGGVREVEREILNTVQRLKQNDEGGQQRRVLVILDGVDFLAAAMGAEVTELMDMVTEIREVRFHFHFSLPFFFSFFFSKFMFYGRVGGKGRFSQDLPRIKKRKKKKKKGKL